MDLFLKKFVACKPRDQHHEGLSIIIYYCNGGTSLQCGKRHICDMYERCHGSVDSGPFTIRGSWPRSCALRHIATAQDLDDHIVAFVNSQWLYIALSEDEEPMRRDEVDYTEYERVLIHNKLWPYPWTPGVGLFNHLALFNPSKR